MKIQKSVTVIEEVEINLPAYFKSGSTFYKVESEQAMQEFSIWDSLPGVHISQYKDSPSQVQRTLGFEPITKEEYQTNLKRAMQLAAKLTLEAIQDDMPQLEMEHTHLLVPQY